MKGQPEAGGTVVMFSTADWAAPCWTNKQHIARRLAERGYTMLYIETVGLRRPSISSLDLTRIIRRLRSGLKPPRRVGERLWVLSPLTLPLGQRHGFVRHFNAWILRTAIRLWLRRHGDGTPPLVWTYHPYMLEAISGLKRSALVYHCVDNIAAVPGLDVALLPLLLNDHTRAVFPMKFFEYLAAGCPVVATSLPALADFSSYCRLTDSAEAFMEGISNALTAPQVIPENDPVLMENNWDRRLDKMLAVLGPEAARAG